MANQRVTKIPTKPQRNKVDTEKMDRGWRGAVEILTRRTSGETDSWTGVGDLTTAELVTIYNQANNIEDGAINGIRTVAELMAAHNPQVRDLDANGVSWLIEHLLDEFEVATNLQHGARTRLLNLGYDERGNPIEISDQEQAA